MWRAEAVAASLFGVALGAGLTWLAILRLLDRS